MELGVTSGGAPRQPTLLLLHHLQPPLEWDRAVAILRAAVGWEGSTDPSEGKETSTACPHPLRNPVRLQQLLRDIQAAVYEGYVQRMALVQQGGGRGPSGSFPQGPPKQQEVELCRLLPKPSVKFYRNVPRLFAAIPQRAVLAFFSKALPLLIKACISADTIFPRCTGSSQQGQGPSPSEAAATAGSPEEEGRGDICACGSCRLRLQLHRHCSSGACSTILSGRSLGPHVSSLAAEISAGEAWVVFGLGFLGLLPPPGLQEMARSFPDLGDLSFTGFFSLAAADQAAKLHCFIRYSCCMAAAIEAFHSKCLRMGVPLFALAPPHLAALCCRDARDKETVRVLSLLLEEEVRCLLPAETAAAMEAESAGVAARDQQGDTKGPSGDTKGPSGDIKGPPGDTKGPSGDTKGPSGDSNDSRTSPCNCCWGGKCSNYLWGPSALVSIPAGALGEGPPGEGPWPLTFPCCFVLRCLRISRAQAGPLCSTVETVALQGGCLLPPEVVEETIDGGGIACSEALDVRADFANKVIGGGILYHGSLQEEIYFAVSPELLLLRPLSQHLRPGEAAHCWGPLRFSGFKGYARSFRCCVNSHSDIRGAPTGAPQRPQQAEQPQKRETADRRPQGEETQDQQEGTGPPRKRKLLLCVGSDDEDEAPGGPPVGPGPQQGAPADTAGAAASWEGWAGTEGVEALDRTPLRVHWLFRRGTVSLGDRGSVSLGDRGSVSSGDRGSVSLGDTSGDPLQGESAKAPPQEETAGASRSNCLPCCRFLMIETASVVAAFDATPFASPEARRGAAAAAEILGAPRAPHSSMAAAGDVVDRSQQYRPFQMLRELQKVCAALHLPPEETEAVRGPASAEGDRGGDSGSLRPFTTGNWGCGFFGGDPQLKFLLQWLGASLSGHRLRYFAWGLPELLRGGLLSRVISAVLEGPRWTAGKLWRVLIEGSLGSPPPLQTTGVFPYVLQHRIAAAPVPSSLGTGDPTGCSRNGRAQRQSSLREGGERGVDEVSLKKPRRDSGMKVPPSGAAGEK